MPQCTPAIEPLLQSIFLFHHREPFPPSGAVKTSRLAVPTFLRANLGAHVLSHSPAGRTVTQRGDKVRFQAADVFLPNADDIRAVFQAEEEMEGTVIDFSDSGIRQNAFAVVEVVQKQTVIVPIEKLEAANGLDTA
jgi:hypothetical protein